MVQKSKSISLNTVILTLICTTYYTLNHLFEWPILAGQYLGAKPRFLDLQQTLNQVECVETAVKRGASFARSTVDCGYVYSRPLFRIHFVPESATTRSPLVGFGPRTLTNLVACRCSTHWLDDFVLAQDSGSNTIDLLATYYASI